MSSTIARIILRKLSASACSGSRSWIFEIFVTPSTMWATSGPKYSPTDLHGRQRVLDHVVEEPGDHARHVELEVGQDVGDLEGMDEVGLAGAAHLVAVLPGGEDVGAAQEVQVRLGVVPLDPLENLLEAPHHTEVAPFFEGGL